MVIFGTDLPLIKKFWESTEKVGYKCTTRNLPLCNGTIIVLKITLHHSVSVITNFVIPKRDQKTTKNIQFFVYSRRATLGMDLLYHHAKYDGDPGSRAGCRQKSVMAFCLFFCDALE